MHIPSLLGRATAAVPILMFALAAPSLHSCQTPSPQVDSTAPLVTASLSLWADSPRARIVNFVRDITDSGSVDFIPVHDRIAVFDNDGTLWPEQPIPTELQFSFDFLKTMAPQHPEWMKDPALAAAIKGDLGGIQKAGMKGIEKIFAVSHTNQTEDAFAAAVRNWIDTAHNRKFNRLYKDLVYAPMVDLLQYLSRHGFKTFIVSGGSADFMRVWAQEVYGIPPYRVVGTTFGAKYDLKNGSPVLTLIPTDAFIDDGAGKPVGIHRFIGKVPVFCAGNSDGDQAMMEYTTGSKYKNLCLIVHHTDADREYQYDTHALSGVLVTALVEAKAKNWMVVDMKNDFKKVFAFQ